MDFVIDTTGQRDLLSVIPGHNLQNDEESEDDFTFIPLQSQGQKSNLRSTTKCTEEKFDLDDTYLDFDGSSIKNSQKKGTTNCLARKYSAPEKILEKSVLQPGVEKVNALPSYQEGRRQAMRKRKMEREKTAGQKWYHMSAPEVTEEMKNDLEVLKMRSSLDPKHFYKKNDIQALPKYFQVGRVIEHAADFYHSRIPKKDRKKTLVDELLADADFQKTVKKRYKNIIAEQQAPHQRAHKQAKRLKKAKK